MDTITIPPRTEQDQPVWFAASGRLINGRPDARYGWLEDAAGPTIVKELDGQLAEFSAGLLDHERRVLDKLRDEDAPVPDRVPHQRSDWLVTRFAGLSLESLAQGPQAELRFPVRERIAAWVHFLGRASVFAAEGVLPIDLWAGNLVLPLTERTEGQLRLHRPVLIDHAHTLVVGMNLRRPVWIHAGMDRIAPELKPYLEADQAAMIRCFRDAGAALPGNAAADAEACRRSARLWARYDAPQQLQAALDRGEVDPAAAIQFAVGVALRKQIDSAPVGLLSGDARQVVARMLSADPKQRFSSLEAARTACARLLLTLPLAGDYMHSRVGPAQLGGQAEEGPLSEITAALSEMDEEGTLFSGGSERACSTSPPHSRREPAFSRERTSLAREAAPARRWAWMIPGLIMLGGVVEQFIPWPLPW